MKGFNDERDFATLNQAVDAMEEHGEDEYSVRMCLKEMHTKLDSCDMLSQKKLDDKFILKFLRARHFDVAAAHRHIKGYFKLRLAYPNLFLVPSRVINNFFDNVLDILPHRTPKGEVMAIMRTGNWEPEKYDILHCMAAPIPFYELMAEEDEDVQKYGVVVILDMRRLAMRSVLTISPFHHKIFAEVMDTGVPVRYNRLHVCYENLVVDIAWNVMKLFMSNEFKQRVVFHGSDLSQLYSEVPKDVLPLDLGGTWNGSSKVWSSAELDEMDEKVTKYWEKYAP